MQGISENTSARLMNIPKNRFNIFFIFLNSPLTVFHWSHCLYFSFFSAALSRGNSPAVAYNSYAFMFMELNHHEDPIVKIYHLNNEKLFLLPCQVYLQMQNTGKAAIFQLHCIKKKVTAFIAHTSMKSAG